MNLLASLRYLVALHEHRHFGRAAQACHITQPALSNALRALEKEFGVVVVRRGRSFEGFTPEGERVLATAQRMLHEHQMLQQDLSSDAAHPRGTLRLGAVPTAMPILARFAAQLQARHPGIVPVALSMSSQALEAGLESIALDLALGYTDRMPARGLGHAVCQAHGAIAANGHHHLQPQRLHIGLHLGQGGGIFQGIGAVAGAQNGAAPVQDARDIVPAQRPCLRLRGHQAFKTVGNAQHLALAIADQGFGHGADDGVQSGAVAAAGEDANFHGGSLSYSRAGSKRSACW